MPKGRDKGKNVEYSPGYLFFLSVVVFALEMLYEYLKDMKKAKKETFQEENEEDTEDNWGEWLDVILKVIPAFIINIMAIRCYAVFCTKENKAKSKQKDQKQK